MSNLTLNLASAPVVAAPVVDADALRAWIEANSFENPTPLPTATYSVSWRGHSVTGDKESCTALANLLDAAFNGEASDA